MDVQITIGSLVKVAALLGGRARVLSHGYEVSLSGSELKKQEKRQTTLQLNDLNLDDLQHVRDVMKDAEESGWRSLSSLINALKDPENKKVTSLDAFPTMLQAYLSKYPKTMLHSLDAVQKGVAYAVISCVYTTRYRDQEPMIQLTLAYNIKHSFATRQLYMHRNTVTGRTVPEILKAEQLMVPDEDMLAAYERIMSRYNRFLGMHGQQFAVRGEARAATDEDRWWESRKTYDLSPAGPASKGVLDMDKADTSKMRTLISSQVHKADVEVPIHPMLPVFSLMHHTEVWVNAADMAEYKYEQGLMDKLVLPASHSRLIGALVANLDVLRMESEAEDKSRTIKAKASSSIILAKGPAGTGKTLTAEVYAEEIKRPLYEISSGVLGSTPEAIEENLELVLQRATRLRMPLLINEADVFVQTRGKDLVQNAVVSIFLRLLEYHRGLVFLTTNRADDIDDAILSRCIAEIAYTTPGKSERKKLWQVLLKEFNVELSKDELEEAVYAFPKVSGRDIQNLIRLTSRVCASVNVPFSISMLKENAVFRSIEILEAGVNR